MQKYLCEKKLKSYAGFDEEKMLRNPQWGINRIKSNLKKNYDLQFAQK